MSEITIDLLDRALKTLEEVVEVVKLERTSLMMDACIQRFEYTFETSRKLLKKKVEASLAMSNEPMSYSFVIRSAARFGYITDHVEWMVFLDDRNSTSHEYNETKAILVFERIPAFAAEARKLVTQLRERFPDEP
jgi:nucleotidyltransferase substrate binding protein (TIGR01987 family)